jgi:hypothetical protein
VRTVAITGLVAAAILAGGWSLEAAGLPAAARGNVDAVKAAEWLTRFRLTSSSLNVHGRPIRGRCYHGWFHAPGGRREHGSLLSLSDGASVRDLVQHALVTTGSLTLRPLAALELAGCTEVLGPRVASFAVANTVRMGHAFLGGHSVLTLRLRRLTLLVASGSDRPLGVVLAGIRSTIHLTRMSPRLARWIEAVR